MAFTNVSALLVLLAVSGTCKGAEKCSPFTLSSNDNKLTQVSIPGARQVNFITLVQQYSGRPCTLGQTFGIISGSDVYVKEGCRGLFHVCYEPGRLVTIQCESTKFRTQSCYAGGKIQSLSLRRQLSGSPCGENRTFRWSSAYIVVENGCRAVFDVWVDT